MLKLWSKFSTWYHGGSQLSHAIWFTTCKCPLTGGKCNKFSIPHSPFSMSLSLWQPLTNTWNSQDNNDDNDDDDDDDDAEDSAQVFFAQFLFNSTKVDQKAFKAFLVVVVTVPPPPPPLFNYYPIRHCLSLSVFTMLSIFFLFFRASFCFRIFVVAFVIVVILYAWN